MGIHPARTLPACPETMTAAEKFLAATFAERQADAEVQEAAEAIVKAQRALKEASDRWAETLLAKNQARAAMEAGQGGGNES